MAKVSQDVCVAIVLAAAVAVFLIPSQGSAADDIEAFGRACVPSLAPVELMAASNESFDSAFRKVVCENYFNEEFGESGWSLGLFVKVVTLDASGNSTNKSVTRKEYCEDAGMVVHWETAQAVFQRFTTEAQLKAWSACMALYASNSNQQLPVPAKLKSVDRDSVVVTLKWDRNVNPAAGPPRYVSIAAIGLACTTSLKANDEISSEGEGHVVTCVWPSNARTGGLTINHSRGSSFVPVTRPDPTPNATVVLNLVKSEKGTVKEYPACGGNVRTPDLHNKKCGPFKAFVEGAWRPINVPNILDWDCESNKWARNKMCAELVVSGAGESIKDARLDCSGSGACGWNIAGAPDRVSWPVNSATHKRACQFLGSHSMDIKVCGTVVVTGNVKKAVNQAKIWPVAPGATFEVTVPVGASGDLVVTSGTNNEVVKLGTSSKSLRLLRADPESQLGPTYAYSYVGWNAAVPSWPAGMPMPALLRKELKAQKVDVTSTY
ncbi:hypothetical protein [Corallococcus llansteffanensis]|uniref:hypothetical protein n=1 Tax=Corallococcus llansteffanensis TaxID=2316731 RepID=UPI0011C404D0|nr:hypothetical protein [Corallococcus llansteffanensis]